MYLHAILVYGVSQLLSRGSFPPPVPLHGNVDDDDHHHPSDPAGSLGSDIFQSHGDRSQEEGGVTRGLFWPLPLQDCHDVLKAGSCSVCGARNKENIGQWVDERHVLWYFVFPSFCTYLNPQETMRQFTGTLLLLLGRRGFYFFFFSV